MTAGPGARGRGRPRDPGTDAAILRAARELFTRHGPAGTSIEQVARRAGVGKPTVYRRWRTKDDLLAAAVESARGDLPSPTADELADVPYEQVARLLDDALPLAARTLADPAYRALLAQVYGSRFTHPGIMAAFWENHVVPRRRAAQAVLRRAAAEGVVPPETDVESLLDMTIGAVLYRILQPGDLSADDLLDYLRRLYRQAHLLPRDGGSP